MTNALGTVRQTSLLTVTHGDTGGDPTTGIFVIAVVCCVLGTSCIWVLIIYRPVQRASEQPLSFQTFQPLRAPLITGRGCPSSNWTTGRRTSPSSPTSVPQRKSGTQPGTLGTIMEGELSRGRRCTRWDRTIIHIIP